jgi:hypothetical protein
MAKDCYFNKIEIIVKFRYTTEKREGETVLILLPLHLFS